MSDSTLWPVPGCQFILYENLNEFIHRGCVHYSSQHWKKPPKAKMKGILIYVMHRLSVEFCTASENYKQCSVYYQLQLYLPINPKTTVLNNQEHQEAQQKYSQRSNSWESFDRDFNLIWLTSRSFMVLGVFPYETEATKTLTFLL